tara:strand:+ start:174 stop:746 length:573 start_codon:yes stop_codon:yes gene_type:complete
LTAGSLKVAESRIIADLLISNASKEEWKAALGTDNLLQVRSPATARRLSTLIRSRLETMSEELWKLVRDGTLVVSTHACLAATVKQSALLSDFLELVVREQYQIFAVHLTKTQWEDYVVACQDRDPELPDWSETTIRRLRSSVFQILAQAGYIENTKTLKLQNLHIADEVLTYLHKHDEDRVIRSIEITT